MFYRSVVLPRLIHAAMGQAHLAPYRRRLLQSATGRVLEIGVGSGLNLPYYPPAARELIGLDVSPALIERARRAAAASGAGRIEVVNGSAEDIPLASGSIDTVVTSWTLCSIPDVERALGEMRRVLRPGGALLFVEHGLSPDAGVARWQDRLTPVWKLIGGGCHLNRPIRSIVESAGFALERIDTGYGEGPRPMAFMYEGRAVRLG